MAGDLPADGLPMRATHSTGGSVQPDHGEAQRALPMSDPAVASRVNAT
jgi:hypothetical protein